MLFKTINLIFFVIAFNVISFAQYQASEFIEFTANNVDSATNVKKCGSWEYLQKQKAEDSELEYKITSLESEINRWINDNEDELKSIKSVTTIPVVVHIIYNASYENISDTRIYEQINVLNKDFRNQNTDGASVPSIFQSSRGDCQLEFCLAQRTPTGIATTGIERRQTTIIEFQQDDAMKYYSQGGLNAWNPTKYLNIWVCNLGGGLGGYAQFPAQINSTYGVVLCYKYVGLTSATYPYNKGRIATHEIGHCFNLIHIWGDDSGACTGTDNCNDTPNQADKNTGCPSFPHITCGNSGDMSMNFMDYSYDACSYLFTNNQATRVSAVINTVLASLKTSDGCIPVNQGFPVAEFVGSQQVIPTGGNVQFTDNSTGIPTTWAWNFGDGYTSSAQNPSHYYNTAGIYTVRLDVSNSFGSDTKVKYAYIVVGNNNMICDTISPVSSFKPCGDSLVYYASNGGGFVTGNNSQGHIEKAQKFIFSGTGFSIQGIWCYNIKMSGSSGNTYVKLYSENPSTKAPYSLLGTSSSIQMSGINPSGLTYYTFSTPVNITSSFFASVVLPSVAGDTLVVVSTKIGCYSDDSLSWEHWADGTWRSIEHAWNANGQGLKIDLIMFPVICSISTGIENVSIVDGITIFPNPVNNIVNIKYYNSATQVTKVLLYDVLGKLVKTIEVEKKLDEVQIDLTGIREGIYCMSIITEKGTIVKRIFKQD